MCAIIGFACPEPNTQALNTLKKLFVESKIRGMHAYGFAAIQNGKLIEYKSNSLKALLDKIDRPTMLIGHCRYSTSGDYKDMNNNQPIAYGDERLVFNGVIDMRTKAEMEVAYQIKMRTENDGEIMLQTSDKMALLKSSVTYSGLMLNKKRIAFFRNDSRPAHVANRHGATFIGSTADILKRCLLNAESLDPYKVYEWTA
jgi:glutamine phosphoribosylpyrophosphate amidotransferase